MSQWQNQTITRNLPLSAGLFFVHSLISGSTNCPCYQPPHPLHPHPFPPTPPHRRQSPHHRKQTRTQKTNPQNCPLHTDGLHVPPLGTRTHSRFRACASNCDRFCRVAGLTSTFSPLRTFPGRSSNNLWTEFSEATTTSAYLGEEKLKMSEIYQPSKRGTKKLSSTFSENG